MIIRPAVVEDAEALCVIHKSAIRQICCHDYSPEQIEAWAGKKNPESYRTRIVSQVAFTAVSNDQIVGFVRFHPETSELCSVFVDPHWARKGVGGALMKHAEQAALALGLTHFWLHASLTAVPFYQSLGYVKLEELIHQFPQIGLPAVHMEKQLVPILNPT